MNLNAIKRNCMALGNAILMNAPGGQWISNGRAAWPVEAVELDEEAVACLFNLSEKQRNKMHIREMRQGDMRFTDWPMDGEEELEALGILEWCGEDWWALRSSRGVLFVEDAPIHHLKRDYLRFCARWEGGRPLIAVYDGMGLEALVVNAGDSDARRMNALAGKIAAPAYMEDVGDAEAEAAEAEAEALARRMEGERT